MGDSNDLVPNRLGATNGGYNPLSSSIARLRARDSSDNVPDLARLCWNGDFGGSVEIPLNANLGGDDGRLSTPPNCVESNLGLP